MHRFTSEFGMDSGGSNALLPPGNLLCLSLCERQAFGLIDQALGSDSLGPKILGVIWSSLTGN